MHHWMNLCISWTSTGFMHHWMNLCISWTSTGFMHHGRNLCIVEWIYASTLTYLPALYLSSSILSVHVLLLLRVIDDLWMCRHMGWQSQMTFEHVMMYCQRLVNPSSHWVPDDLRMCRDGCRWLINTSRVVYCELFVAGFIYFVSWMAFEHVMIYCRLLMNPSSRWVFDDLWTCRDVCRCLINTSRVAFSVTYSSLDLVSLCLVDELWTYHAIVSSDYEYVMGCFLRDLFVERIVYSTLIIAFYWCVFKNYWLFLLQDLL